MDKYVNYNAAEVLVFIYPMVERLKSKIKTLYLPDKFDFLFINFFMIITKILLIILENMNFYIRFVKKLNLISISHNLSPSL